MTNKGEIGKAIIMHVNKQLVAWVNRSKFQRNLAKGSIWLSFLLLLLLARVNATILSTRFSPADTSTTLVNAACTSEHGAFMTLLWLCTFQLSISRSNCFTFSTGTLSSVLGSMPKSRSMMNFTSSLEMGWWDFTFFNMTCISSILMRPFLLSSAADNTWSTNSSGTVSGKLSKVSNAQVRQHCGNTTKCDTHESYFFFRNDSTTWWSFPVSVIEFSSEEFEANNAARQDERRQAVRKARDDRDIIVSSGVLAMEGIRHQKSKWR